MTDRRRLYLGDTFTGVTIEPDAKYPNMWRVHAKGQVSDMVNLARARDAGHSWASSLGHRDRGVGRIQYNWRRGKDGGGSDSVRFSAAG